MLSTICKYSLSDIDRDGSVNTTSKGGQERHKHAAKLLILLFSK